MESGFKSMEYASLLGASVTCDTVRNRAASSWSHSGYTRAVTIQDNVLRNIVSPAVAMLSEVKEGVSDGVSLFARGVVYCPKKLCEFSINIACVLKWAVSLLIYGPNTSSGDPLAVYAPSDERALSEAYQDKEYEPIEDEPIEDEFEQKTDADDDGYSLEDFKRDEQCSYKLGTKAKRIDDTLLLEAFIAINRMSQYHLDHNPRGLLNPARPIETSFERLSKWVVTAQERSYSDETVTQINNMIKELQKKIPDSTEIKLLPLANESVLNSLPKPQPVVRPQVQSVQIQQQVYTPPARQYNEPVRQYNEPVRQYNARSQMQPQQAQPQYVRPYGMQPQPQIQQQYEHPRPIQPQNVYPVQEHQQPSRKECWNHLPEPQYYNFKEARFPAHLQKDPYLICPRACCKRQFEEGQLPEYRHHIDYCGKKTQPAMQKQTYVSDGINAEIKRVANQVRNPSPELAAFYEFGALDPHLICYKCNRQFREGQLPEFRHHIDDCRV